MEQILHTTSKERYEHFKMEYGGLTGSEIHEKISKKVQKIATQIHSHGRVQLAMGLFCTDDDLNRLHELEAQLEASGEHGID